MADETTTEGMVSEPTPEIPTAHPVEPLEQEPIPEPQTASEPPPEPSIPTPQPSLEATVGTAEPTQALEPIVELEPVISEPVSAPEPQPVSQSTPAPEPEVIAPVSLVSRARELLVKAREAIQFRKRKKLEKIMNLFLKKQSITNDDVQKLLYVSDATATRYLKQLETEGRIRRENAGKYLSYSRI